jgi:hypothetical protein
MAVGLGWMDGTVTNERKYLSSFPFIGVFRL